MKQYRYVQKKSSPKRGLFQCYFEPRKVMPSPFADHDHISAKALSGQREQSPG